MSVHPWFNDSMLQINNISDGIKKFLTISSEKNEDFHDNYTPFDLCNEIVDKLHQQNLTEGKWLVIANIEFAYVIKKYFEFRQWDLSNLYFVTPSLTKKKFVVKMGILEYNIGIYNYETLDVCGDFKDMKFDVIVGNPPYQYGHGSNRTLFHKFYSVAMKHSSRYICFIAPTTWLTSRKKLLMDLKSQLFNGGLQHVTMLDSQKTFGVYVDALGYTFQDVTMPPVLTTSVTQLNGCDIKVELESSVLGDSMSTDIVTKIKKLPQKLNAQRGRHYNVGRDGTCWDNSCSFVQSIAHPHKMINKVNANKSGIEYAYVNKQSAKSAIGVIKVMFSYLSSRNNLGAIIISNDIVELSHMCVYIPVSSSTEGENLKFFLQSKIFQFVLPFLRPNTTNTVGVFRDVSIPPLHISYTDQELYQHFNLSQDEINLIEGTIK